MPMKAEDFDKLLLPYLTRGFAFFGPLPPKDPKSLVPQKSHVCIIMNNKVTIGEDILYFFITSEYDKVIYRYRDDRNGYVDLDEEFMKEYFNDPELSCIQCGESHLNSIKYHDFKYKYITKVIEKRRRMEIGVITRIEKAIKESKSYDNCDRKRYFEL